MNNKRFYSIILVFVLILAIMTSILGYKKIKDKPQAVSYTSFLNYLEHGIVEKVELGDSPKISIVLNNGQKVITDNPRTADFKKELLMYDVEVIEEGKEISQIFIFTGLILGLLALVIYFKRNISKQAEMEMASISKVENIDYDANIKFSDVAGNEEAKDALKEMVDFIKNPEVYNSFGARLPRGVLLYGPPGTGKTLLAKALAGEAGVPIFPVSGSDFVQVYTGLGASRIRNLFKMAKEAGKSVIFIDEIDSLGKKRKGSNISGSEEGDRTLNALLAEMSGFKENEGIIVVAATNRIDVLDEALLRPGRFDRQIEVQLPDVKAREKILRLHCRNKPLAKEVDLKKLAVETVYFSGAKLENLLNESAMMAVRTKDKEITNEHINKAYYKILVGEEKKDRSCLRSKDREITAYHEAGHALIAKLVSKENRVTKVSIIPSTRGMGGFSLNIPPDKMYQTKKEILSNVMVALGGRAAEEFIYGKDNVTTGASSDLEKATEIVLALIGVYGMDSSTGLLNYNVAMSKELSGDINLLNRGKDILESLYKDTIDILKEHRDILENIAKALLEKEVLEEEEIDALIEF
ncbi:ATP-dependent metallopeptidase FtsH/Yme1/Tma family protein [Tissierellaceae bacterium HCP3S3_D8]